ncbi:MAG: ADP-forming succinate--CoA ligase subunit beta, partial [Alphaproteobacteria bacterium]
TQTNNNFAVVKAQIHAGGRGKAGGVKLARSHQEAIKIAKEMFGVTLVTHQTGPKGQKVRRVYIEEGSNIEKEYYLSLILDRVTSSLVFIASTEGGVDIEEVAESHPDQIIKVSVKNQLWPFHARKLGFQLGLRDDKLKNFVAFIPKLYKVFVETDASQIEINPLVLTTEGEFIALDAKLNFDDNALFRQKAIAKMRDEDEEDPLELRAQRSELNYVKMDGAIGCMVNGAGLAMATMDIVKLYGAEPANFLDVGGGATKERVAEAFKIILSDSNVKALLINIFGGIMRCNIIAEGIISAAKEVGVNVPIVVRLAGTNFELGKKMLDESGLKIISADDLADAARKAVLSIKTV